MKTSDSSVFQKAKILVVGDVMLDRYIWGHMERISPEAPVPIVRSEKLTQSLGGAANVAANLRGLGCQVHLVGVRGQDLSGEKLSERLRNRGIHDHLITVSSRPTTTKTRIMSQRQQVLRIDEENTTPLEVLQQEAIVNTFKQLAAEAQVIILSDYGKGTLDTALCKEIMSWARSQSLPIFVDPKGKDWSKYTGATCITPNTAELELRVGNSLDSETELTAAGTRVIYETALNYLLITRGPKGMVLLSRQDPPLKIFTQASEVFDVSGAGDTVISTLAAAVASNMDWASAARLANVAAGIVVGLLGTQPISAHELDKRLNQPDDRIAKKVCDIDSVRSVVREWKIKGEKIVFTNGCFDLLHPGHIKLLKEAATHGTKLVVAINSDDSVRRIKGMNRPVLSEKDRATILAAIECVDLVTVFDQDTPIILLEALHPDLLVKGADCNHEDIVSHDLMKLWGGRVLMVPLLGEISTSTIIRDLGP